MLNFALCTDNLWTPPELVMKTLADRIDKAAISEGASDYMAFVCTEPYIDAVLIHRDSDNDVPHLTRFVFHEGYQWDYDTQRSFIDLCLNNPRCRYTGSDFDRIYRYYSEHYPDWKLKSYRANRFKMLDHIYHCMQRGTAKEMLYKAGLDFLAANIEDIDEISLFSTKPSDIYSGLPMRVLRVLNCRAGSMLLSTAHKREFIKDLQNKFQDLFDSAFNDAQCIYLDKLIQGDLTVGEAGRLFRARRELLACVWAPMQLNVVLSQEKGMSVAARTLAKLYEIDPLYKRIIHIDPSKMTYVDDRIWSLKSYVIDNRDEYDAAIRRANRKRDANWQERDRGYVVRYPQTINDFCREAMYMGNCLMTYIDALIGNDTTILFVRKSDDVNMPFITMEIFEGDLMQAYHRFNEDCTPEEAEWIRDYCVRHRIGIHKFAFDRNVDLLF